MAENGAMFPPPRNTLRNFLSFFCLAFFLPIFSVQASKRADPFEVQDLLQRQMGWDENLPNEKNPAGLHFQFFKIDEAVSSGKRLVSYRVYVPGIPENKKYQFIVWKIGSDPRTLSGNVYVNAKGLLMVRKPTQGEDSSDFVGDDELHLSVQAARGEPLRYALASTDKRLLISGTVVPFPLEDAEQSCRLEVRLGLPDGEGVLISADGLPANTGVPFQWLSAGEPGTGKFSVNAQGRAVTAYVPSVNGKERGSLKVTLTTKDCSAAVEIPWGKGSYQPL
jgi:hypothetical protein